MGRHSKRGAAREGDGAGDGGVAGHRHERLTRLIHEEIAALVRDELDDPRLAGVVVTYVELSVDYKNARVGFIVRPAGHDGGPSEGPPYPAGHHGGSVHRERVGAALGRATPLLRARLAEAVDLKVLPALRFVWDAIAAAAPAGF